jgi:8-oxo-dGTP pyrophosphatase MutT (NUDIX family)
MAAVSETPIQAAIGVVWDETGRVLVGTRPSGKVYAGYDEFPGETLQACVARELMEETGLAVRVAPAARLTVTHRYPHGLVAAHFFDAFALPGAVPAPPYRFVPVEVALGLRYPEANGPLLAELRATPGPAEEYRG